MYLPESQKQVVKHLGLYSAVLFQKELWYNFAIYMIAFLHGVLVSACTGDFNCAFFY